MVQRAMLLPLFLAAVVCVFCSCGKRSGSPKPQVVLYCSVDQELAKQIVAEFEKRTHIKVQTRYDSEAGKTVGLVQKIIAESPAPLADVFWSGEVFHTIRVSRLGLLAPYVSDDTAGWPAGFADPNGLWYGFALRARVIAYNTKRVSADQAPKTLEDVLDAQWQGRVTMAVPEFGTTGGDIASWFVHYGFDRAHEILLALKANKIRLVDGNSTAVRMVATGQADICFTDTDDVYAAQRNGWPIAMNYLDQGGDGSLVIPNTAALIKNAPHPEQARKLMEFLLSRDVERMLAQSYSHNSPIRPDLAAEFESWAITQPLKINYENVADTLETAIRAAGDVLR